jgi:hypothetical protein
MPGHSVIVLNQIYNKAPGLKVRGFLLCPCWRTKDISSRRATWPTPCTGSTGLAGLRNLRNAQKPTSCSRNSIVPSGPVISSVARPASIISLYEKNSQQSLSDFMKAMSLSRTLSSEGNVKASPSRNVSLLIMSVLSSAITVERRFWSSGLVSLHVSWVFIFKILMSYASTSG